MKVEKTSIEGLLILTPQSFEDERGVFFESYNEKDFEDAVGFRYRFVQDNHSISHKDVIRGLHFQKDPHAQGKLVRVLNGLALDVAVDLRPDSPTYGQHESVVLGGGNRKMFWVPDGFAHGFRALADNTHFFYKCTDFYNKESEGGILYNDSELGIDWGAGDPIVSEKDMVLPPLKNLT